MDLAAFIKVRPYAFHTTARVNLVRIAETTTLACPAALLGVGDPRMGTRRRTNLTVAAGGRPVVIRSQAPLAQGNIEFEDGWDLSRLVALLNSLVFFWPGTERGPRDNGVRHFHGNSASGEKLAVLRVPTKDLFRLNPAPKVSACNSGSPRMSGGKKCRRGSGTFVSAEAFTRPPSKVVELVFADRVELPATTHWSPSLDGSWSALAEARGDGQLVGSPSAGSLAT